MIVRRFHARRGDAGTCPGLGTSGAATWTSRVTAGDEACLRVRRWPERRWRLRARCATEHEWGYCRRIRVERASPALDGPAVTVCVREGRRSGKIGWAYHRLMWMAETIYLDYAATTPVDPAVVEAMLRYMGPEGVFANPASNAHAQGQAAAKAVEEARERVADLIGATSDELVWTSGATESINLAIKGVATARARAGRHIVTSCLEHSAVLGTCEYLAQKGYEVTALRPDGRGMVTAELVRGAVRDDTILVSLMQANNETGTVTDVGAIGEVCAELGIAFHVDAAQSAARLPVDVRKVNAGLVSLSGHKLYGPKGVGALYVRGRSDPGIGPQMHGGDQEMGLRAGTLATHQIVGMGKAAELVAARRKREVERIGALENLLFLELADISRTCVNGGLPRVPGIVNLRFDCVDNESLMLAVRDRLSISSGSACTSTRVEPSHVLLGLGLTEEEANWSVRVSLGRYTTEEEVRGASALIREAVGELRSLSDEWEEGGVAGGESRPNGSVV